MIRRFNCLGIRIKKAYQHNLLYNWYAYFSPIQNPFYACDKQNRARNAAGRAGDA